MRRLAGVCGQPHDVAGTQPRVFCRRYQLGAHGGAANAPPGLHLESVVGCRRRATRVPIPAWRLSGARLGSGGEQVYLYYTYLEPGATFASRYMVRRPVRMLSTDYRDGVAAGCGGDANGSNVLLSLTPYTNGRDHWMTTAMVPVARGYRPTVLRPLAVELGSDSTGGGGVYVNTRQSSPLQHAIYDCYITQWKDHMVALAGECGDGISSRVLRLLGWVYTHAPSVGAGARPLWRCFNNATSDHATSLTGDCAHDVGPGYHTEFILGYVTVLPQSVSA